MSNRNSATVKTFLKFVVFAGGAGACTYALAHIEELGLSAVISVIAAGVLKALLTYLKTPEN